MIARVVAQQVERRAADAARRQVDDALEGDVVVARLREAQVRQGVLDLGALEEPQAAVDAVRDSRRHQRLLEGAGLRVRAVEHGGRGERQPAALVLADAVDDEIRLVAFVEGGVDADRFAALDRGPELLAHAVGVLRDDGVRGGEDHGGRAVVLLQAEDRRVVLAAEVLHVLDARAAPAVDGLVVVADDERRAGLADELPDPVVLDAVRVLELVHQDVAEALAVVLAEVGRIAQELEAAQHELGEIHDARGLAALLVQLVEADELLARRVVAVSEVLRAAALVLARIDEVLDFARHPALLVELLLADDLAHEALLVVVVEDLEGLRQAGPRASGGGASGAKGRGRCRSRARRPAGRAATRCGRASRWPPCS